MLYELQNKILNESKEKYLFNLGTGTGKSLIALHHYLKYGNNDPIYIIAPAAKVKEQGWNREIDRVFTHYNKKQPPYKIVSYGKLKNTEFKKGYYIIDECHYIKNPSAKRSKEIKQLLKTKANNYCLLSATPTSKYEEWVHYLMIWGLYKYKTHFYNDYVVQARTTMGYKSFLTIVGYKNIDKLKEIIASISSKKYTVNDIVEMPELINQYINFKASANYKKILKNRLIENDKETILLDTQPKLAAYLRQNTNTKDKIEYLKMIIETLGNNNLLIFYNFNSELKEITKNFKIDYIINGNIKEYPRKDEFNKQQGKITLVQIQAGGVGIELTYNNLVVYYSPTYSYQDYEQSIGRSYRMGQKEKVIVYKFNTKKTIEEKVWQSLEQKQDFNEKLWSE